jgi:hypothetical protein
MREFKQDFDIVLRDVEQNIADLMTKRYWSDDRFDVQKRTSTDRRNWDHEALAKKVIALAMDSGRIHHPMDVAAVLRGAAGFSYWRVTQLKELGIDPDEYADSSPGKTSIQITRREVHD